MADVIPHCDKAVYIVPPCTNDVMLSNYIKYKDDKLNSYKVDNLCMVVP